MLKETFKELKNDAESTDIKSLAVFTLLFSGVMCILNICTGSLLMASAFCGCLSCRPLVHIISRYISAECSA